MEKRHTNTRSRSITRANNQYFVKAYRAFAKGMADIEARVAELTALEIKRINEEKLGTDRGKIDDV